MIASFTAWAGIAPTEGAAESLRAEWSFHAYTNEGEVRAIAAMAGSEIHFAVAPQWRGRVIARQRARDFLAPLFAKHGFLTTRSEPDEKNRDFLERIGFLFTWNDGRFDHYMMHELPFSGKGN